MSAATGIRLVGNNLVTSYDDGTQRMFAPTSSGIFIPVSGHGTPTGGGGEGPGVPPTGGAPGTAAAPVDDYPWPAAPQNDMSPLRYSYRDCTDFAAWRINRDLGCTHEPWMYTWGQLRITNGDAIGWKPDWLAHGWPVSSTPQAGMLGWYGTKAGSYGHVCYIQAVAADGTVTIEEYNWLPFSQAYNTNLRRPGPGDALYPDAFLGMPPAR